MNIHVPMQKTRSEITFERWLSANGLSWRPVPRNSTKTPDYAVNVAPRGEIIFELKQIETARNWKADIVHGSEVGAFIRERINGSKSQMKASSKQGKPTVLVIFNDYDPIQLFGTEDRDFIHAMYGEYTIEIGVESRNITARYLGKGKYFQAKKNTSFSAIARLKESGREATISVTIFENIHAAVPINYDALPSCFEVMRF